MKNAFLVLLSLVIFVSGSAQETSTTNRQAGTGRRPAARRGEAAGYSSRDATVLSMMGWGLGIAVGIAALCALIDNNTGEGTSAHSH